MSKEKVFIVMSHKHSLKKGSKTEWEVTETVEFINQLRTRHYTSSSAIADYINRSMITGSRVGMDTYDKFESYVKPKYEEQFKKLDDAYGMSQVITDVEESTMITDKFGNVREPTVFDAPEISSAS